MTLILAELVKQMGSQSVYVKFSCPFYFFSRCKRRKKKIIITKEEYEASGAELVSSSHKQMVFQYYRATMMDVILVRVTVIVLLS